VAAVTRAGCALLAAAAASAASGQQNTAPVDPVVSHFREYRAALERDDLRAAEAAATAALEASEAASGRRTAVLALNLANLRLELGEPYDALPPARTAQRLATTSADAGVDPVAATLTLGRAELAADDPAGASRLLETMSVAVGKEALATDTYNASVALGTWGIEKSDRFGYNVARTAWGTAERLAHTTDDPTFARARARTGAGAAIALAGMDRTASDPRGSPIELSPFDAKAANDDFSVALRLLEQRALADAPSAAGPAPVQQVYAQALGWQAALLAKAQSLGQGPPAPPSFGNDVPPQNAGNHCAMRVIRDGTQIAYPAEALDRYGVGAVVVQLGVDAIGTATSRTVAAAIPPGTLGRSVEAVVHEWRTEKDPNAAPSCRMPGSVFVPVRFSIEERG
jgi:hypothetical protein